jgi:2-dehydropantoate 2-reductase
MTFDHVIVLGAGSIGSIFGALLSREHDVLLVGRAAHMKAIREKGLKVVGDAVGIYWMATATRIEEILPHTLLVVTVKAHQLEESLVQVCRLVRKDTVILLLQNGLGIEQIARNALNTRGKIVCGIVAFGVEILEPGRIFARLGFTFLDSDSTSKEVARFLKSAGFSVVNSEKFQTDVWRKVVINCVANPLSAILRAPTKTLVSSYLASVRRSIVEECIAVARAERIQLDLSILEIIDTSFPNFENRTSMLQDILGGRKTEIDFLNGRIVELGKKHKIPTPVNETLTQLIRFLEVGPQ